MQTPLVALLILAYAALAPAAEYERRLIPIVVSLAPGAYGSVWRTRVTAVQELKDGAEIVGDMTLDVPPWLGGSQPYGVFPLLSDHEPPGAILHVRKDVAPAIHISARLEQRGSSELEEFPIPVVAEDDFVNHTLYFMPLTRRTDRRMHLRVYSLDVERETAAVRVRIQARLPIAGWSFVYDEVHPLGVEQKTMTSIEGGEPLPLRPFAIEMLLDSLLAELPPDTELAVSVLPADEGLRIWGIVSETDNATHRVRLTLPQ
jgi:hypothetical protein